MSFLVKNHHDGCQPEEAVAAESFFHRNHQYWWAMMLKWQTSSETMLSKILSFWLFETLIWVSTYCLAINRNGITILIISTIFLLPFHFLFYSNNCTAYWKAALVTSTKTTIQSSFMIRYPSRLSCVVYRKSLQCTGHGSQCTNNIFKCLGHFSHCLGTTFIVSGHPIAWLNKSPEKFSSYIICINVCRSISRKVSM